MFLVVILASSYPDRRNCELFEQQFFYNWTFQTCIKSNEKHNDWIPDFVIKKKLISPNPDSGTVKSFGNKNPESFKSLMIFCSVLKID